MAKYRKKSPVIEAEQFLHTGGQMPFHQPPLPFAADNVCRHWARGWYLQTYDGPKPISNGDWIIKGESGEFDICTPYKFPATYEPAD